MDPRRTRQDKRPAGETRRPRDPPGRPEAGRTAAVAPPPRPRGPRNHHLQQARRGDRVPPRSRRPAHGLRQAAETRQWALDLCRQAGHQQRRPADLHHGRRTGQPPHASLAQGGAGIRRADIRRDLGGAVEPPGPRGGTGGRTSALRGDHAGRRGGHQPLVPRRAHGGPQARGPASLGGRGADG